MINFLKWVVIVLVLGDYAYSSTRFSVGSTFRYGDATYRVDYVRDGQCASGASTLTEIVHIGSSTSNVFNAPTDDTAGCDTRYYHAYAYIVASLVNSSPCDSDSQGLCYQYICDQPVIINGHEYIKNNITDVESCTTNLDGTDTGNIWYDSIQCSAPVGACLRENNCTAPEGYTEVSGITSSSQCDAALINASLQTDTTMAISQTIWQECDSKCYAQTIPVDCASQTPYTPTLGDGETIYSTDLTLAQCVDYANQNNMDVRYDEYKTNEAPGFSCQDLHFCITKDRPRSCQGVVTPLPQVTAGQTYFIVDDPQQCLDYSTSFNVMTNVVHFDDKDNAGQFCYDIDYCVVTPTSDNNGSTIGDTGTNNGDTGGSTSGGTDPLPDNTGTNTGTGAQSIDLNGTNERLDIIDGHIKDLSQTVRDGYDRNHADLNRLSQDIQDGSQLINRGINGLSHSISSALDTIAKSGDINVTADFDDTRIVQANNNTTRAITQIGSYFGSDNNVSDLNVTFSEFEPIAKAAEDAIETMNTTLADSNVSKEELTTMIEDDVTQSMTDFEDKSKTMLSDLLDRIFSNTFNPFQPFIDVGSVPSNFGSLHFPVNIDAINYHQDVYISKSQLMGDQSDPNIAKFYEIMKKLLLFLAVFFGFLHMIRGVSNV
jgi:hypothetical protein